MRTLLTNEDVKNFVNDIFYDSQNSEEILLVDEGTGEKTTKDLASYLNVKFYTWKDRLVEKGEGAIDENPELSTFDTWVQSMNYSMNESYALVETIDEEVVASQDIDSATKTGKITLLIQADKIKNLEYYLTKLRNIYLGNPQTIQNAYGDKIKAYIMLGILSYDQEPITMQLGECIIASFNFRISYLNDALTYSDMKFEISLDGDDTYNENGEIVGDTNFLEMPLTKVTWQKVFASTPVPTTIRPDLTGFIATSLSDVKTLSFYDYNKELSKRIDTLFWQLSAYRVDGVLQERHEINIPIFIRVTTGGHKYTYKDMIDNIEKVVTNNDFNISSITLKGWGKVTQE